MLSFGHTVFHCGHIVCGVTNTLASPFANGLHHRVYGCMILFARLEHTGILTGTGSSGGPHCHLLARALCAALETWHKA